MEEQSCIVFETNRHKEGGEADGNKISSIPGKEGLGLRTHFIVTQQIGYHEK